MAVVKALVLHDELGRIISIARPAEGIQVVVGAPDAAGQIEAEVEEGEVEKLIASRRVDAVRRSLVDSAPASAAE